MVEDVVQKIEKSVWYEAAPLSPKLPPETFGIAFVTAIAEGINGLTVALFGVSELIGSYGEQYGGRIPGAMEVIAVDVRSGGLYHARGERMDSAPLQVVPASTAARAEGMVLGSVGTHFNIDLCEHLALPARAATYNVFVWLDDCISAVQQIEVPHNPARQAQSAKLNAMRYPQPVHFRESVHTPKAVPGRPIIGLVDAAGAAPMTGAAVMIAGNIHGQDLPDKTLLSDDPQPVLHLLVRGRMNRELVWHSERIEPRLWRNQTVAFDCNLAEVVNQAYPGDEYFAIAMHANAISNIVKFTWPSDV